MTELMKFDNGMYKRILNLLESVNLRFRKVVVETIIITVGKFAINSESYNVTDCFGIKIRADTVNVNIVGFKKRDEVWSQKVRYSSETKPSYNQSR